MNTLLLLVPLFTLAQPGGPKVVDPRLVIEQFAAAPDIVHPVGLDFDLKGRMLVIESHTHFPPAGYKGLKHDRIVCVEDTDGDGKADRFTTFFEGTKHTMDIAVHPEGSVYLATRNEVLRLRDTDGDGKADEKTRLVFLETKGDYPHNGLSGLCFDFRGDLLFGMGENLGATFKILGSDGTAIAGAGDGGHIFRCTADGKKLRKVATGFWNPFGICRDIFGRTFTVDNDPDAMPPCRLLHVIEGGDYGFQFRYGRQGRHPFQAWNGELPGTLPMVAGTGEAPCEVLSYESDGLPREYLGNLLVTSWADHRVERYVLKEKGASFTSQREPFVQGGKDFRPVGMAVAPDGSLFISDWVLRDYSLHGKGALWHIRAKNPQKTDRTDSATKGLFSLHRPQREAAARKLDQATLRQHLDDKNVRVRATCAAALFDQGIREDELLSLSKVEREIGLRGLLLAKCSEGKNVRGLMTHPALKLAGIHLLDSKELLARLDDDNPFVRTAAVERLARLPLPAVDASKNLRVRLGIALAHRAADGPESRELLANLLVDRDDDIRFLAAKWIADERLLDYRRQLAETLKDPTLNVRLYWAFATALARLEGQEVNENRLAEYFLQRLTDEKTPPGLRTLALQLVPAKHGRLTANFLQELIKQPAEVLQLEAVRTLADIQDGNRKTVLSDVLHNESFSETVRAQAIVGLANETDKHVDDWIMLAQGKSATLRDEALRALTRTKLTNAQKQKLEEAAARHPRSADLFARALDRPFFAERLPTKDVDGWLKKLEGPCDPAAGRRVFSHPRLANCYRCHRVEGRGSDIGPDLSTIGRIEIRSILESILQPSNNIAPHFQAWLIETDDGKIRTGMLTHTNLDEYTYVDDKGGAFKVNTRDVASIRPVPTSIMPDGLINQLTDQEIRDLLAYLASRR